MSWHRVLPGAQQLVIILLLCIDASLVLDLCQFGSALLVHAVLQVTAHGAITLTDLAKHISLVGLAVVGLLEGTLLKQTVLSVDLGINLLLVVLSLPLGLLLHGLLQKDISLTVLVDILEEIDASLVLTSPLLLSGVPLLFVLLLSQVVNHPLVGLFVVPLVLVVLLKLLDLATASQSLICLVVLDSLLASQGGIKELLVSLLFHHVLLLSELLLSGVVSDQLQVSFTVEQEPLIGILLLLLLLNSPLLLEHGLLSLHEVLFLGTLHLAGLLLPLEHGHSVLNLLLLLTSLLHLTLKLFLGIKLPQLGVDLLFDHLLLNMASLVDQLLLALNSRTVVVELGIFLPQGVVLSLKLHVLATCNLISALLLTLLLQGLKTLEHLFTDLLGRFQVVVKLLFINAIFSCKKLSEFGLPLLKVGSLSAAHVVNAVTDDVLLDKLASLGLPVGLVCQVQVATDVVHHARVFLSTDISSQLFPANQRN